jgi:hypothetical protein
MVDINAEEHGTAVAVRGLEVRGGSRTDGGALRRGQWFYWFR